MTAAVLDHAPQAAPEPAAAASYLTEPAGWRAWLFATDHKRIAVLYVATVTLFFFVGGAAATLIRLNLVTPKGSLVTAELYNKLFTAHGIVMVWFFLIPVIPTVLGNFLLPMMIGAKDLAFPRLNLLSWYVFVAGAGITLTAVLVGGVDSGWTLYPPFSTRAATTYVVPAAVGIFVAGFSSIMTGLNFIVTLHTLRCPGLTWGRLPLFCWSLYATSLILVLATPVLAGTLVLIAVERLLGIGVFDPALGGDPVLFQHLFWFYSHPAVYIMILPGMGVISEVVTCFSRKNVFGYKFLAAASVGIAVFGFLVWGHHMFVAGQSLYASMIFSALSYLVAVPSAVKVFNWTATMYRGSIAFEAPMLYALGFIVLFTVGGLSGLFLAALAVDQHVHDTYFIVAHFHFIMVGGMVSAYFAGLHYWWPKATGRRYSRPWSRLAALLIFAGFMLTFLPQFVLGYLGMPRRYHQYPAEFQVLNVLSSAGASILAVGYLLPFAYLFASLRWGEPAGPNPWGATGLEWQTASPPPPHNFAETPTVTRGPYEYATEDAPVPADAPALEPQFSAPDQQRAASELGMWAFLATEALLFGGIVTAFLATRHLYPHDFEAAAGRLNVLIGGVNTLVLLASSLTMALAVHAAGRGGRLSLFLGLTALLGAAFLGLKGYEYYADWRDGLVPRTDRFAAVHPGHFTVFMTFYFVLTGLHAVHLSVGIGLVGWLAAKARREDVAATAEVVGLYWHFVDVVWIFLLPLFYLSGHHELGDLHF